MKTVDFDRLVEKITDKVMERLAIMEPNHKSKVLGNNQELISSDLFIGFQKMQQASSSSAVIITELSFENLVNCMQFQPVNDFEKEIIESIKAGKELLVIKEGRTYLSLLTSGKYALKQKIQELEYEFYRYGGKFISLSELKQPAFAIHNSLENKTFTHKKYLTVKDILENKLDAQATIEISKETVLTDYAKEYVREKEIKIIQANEK